RPTNSGDHERSWENLDSSFEEDFIYKHLPNTLSEHTPDINNLSAFIAQLFSAQRSMDSIIKGCIDPKTLNPNVRHNFNQQRVDFYLEFPYSSEAGQPKGVVIEVDGSQHLKDVQQFLDSQRDIAVRQSGWAPTVRIPTESLRNRSFVN